MCHAPSGFIGAANLALQFLGRHPVARAGHEVHGEEPVGERCARFFKYGPDARVDVMATMLAGISAALAHPVEL